MERLKNKTIFIGKEPGQGRLMIAIKINGNIKTAIISNTENVSNCVSRLKPQENVAHCKIDLDENCSMVITNLKPQNTTYVNNIEIVSKRITKDSVVTLGYEKYPININSIIEAATKLFSAKDLGPISIKHLEAVWNDYESTLDNIKSKQLKKVKGNNIAMGITSSIGIISSLFAMFNNKNALFFTLPLMFAAAFIRTKNSFKEDTSLKEQKEAQKKLIDNYITPCCSHYLGQQQYYAVQKNKTCPYCKREWKK